MRTLVVYLLMLCIPCAGLGQLKTTEAKAIKSRLLFKINQLRKEIGVDTLILKVELAKPATVHSSYMSKSNKLTHGHSNIKFNDPKKRVEHFSPLIFDAVGENILLSKRVSRPLGRQSINKLADEMFNSWKNSPGHYANMIDREFDSCNFGFAFNHANQVYATNLFAKIGVKIPGQLSNNQFNLQADVNDACQNARNFHSNILVNVGNAIKVENNEIFFYYHDKNRFMNMFSGPYDGIAVDVLKADQFSCDEVNQLDISPIHDGILLKPNFRDEILLNNKAQSEYRVIASIGKIPEHLISDDIHVSALMIKNGVVCKYVVPSFVPSGDYPLKKLSVNHFNPANINLNQNSSIRSESYAYDFEANRTMPKKLPNIKTKGSKVVAVEIKSFSSIEGTAERNETLHLERAEVIKRHLSKAIDFDMQQINVQTKENWDQFYFQLKYHFADSLLNKTKDELRNIASEKTIAGLPWNNLLSEQRKSHVTIYFEHGGDTIKSKSSINHSNLKWALINNDTELANKALYAIYVDKTSIPHELFDESVFETLLEEELIVQNVSAILLGCHSEYPEHSTKFLNKWIVNAKGLSPETIFNLLNLYTLVNKKLLDKWDLPSQRLSNVLRPQHVKHLSEVFYSDDLVLNLHLTFIDYYGHTNNGPKITESFEYISKYFLSRVLEIEDYIALSKFYNNWSMYSMTVNMLHSKFEEIAESEEAMFLLLRTLIHSHDTKGVKDYEKLHKKGIELNQSKWCFWMKSELSHLRDSKLKNLYCSECK